MTILIVSIYGVYRSIFLFSDFHSTVKGNMGMKDPSFEGIFTYSIGEK